MIKSIKLGAGRGFTLLELMMVVAIIGITVALGVPSLQSIIVDNRLSSSANDMLAALQIARSEAAKRVRFSGVKVSGNAWIVFVGSENNVVQSYTAAKGITLSDAGTILFRPEGRLNSSSSIAVVFTATGSEKRTLTIAPSGKITITHP